MLHQAMIWALFLSLTSIGKEEYKFDDCSSQPLQVVKSKKNDARPRLSFSTTNIAMHIYERCKTVQGQRRGIVTLAYAVTYLRLDLKADWPVSLDSAVAHLFLFGVFL